MCTPVGRWLRALSLLLFAAAGPARAIDWLPVTQDELQLKSVPEAPGAPAIYLYEQVDRDDSESYENVYRRIKILNDEGRKYATIELEYLKDAESIRGLEARTIHPDGTIVRFDGKIYDKAVVTSRNVKIMAKALTLPDVTPGCIVEYRYMLKQSPFLLYNSQWMLSQDLYLSSGKFSLVRWPYNSLRWSWPNGLPPGASDPHSTDGKVITLQVHGVPPFVKEDHMPPEADARYRVDFIYYDNSNNEHEPGPYWKRFGKQAYQRVERFTDQNRAMNQALAQIVQPGDSPAARLRKIYARMQQVRNLTFERERTEEEKHREHLRDLEDVGDVWKANAGTRDDITWLFLALVRAAGIPADPVLVSTRDENLFNPRTMNPHLLNATLVVAKLEGRDVYLAPGIPFTAFGALPWYETDTSALRLDKDGGTFVPTPLPDASESRIERQAELKLVDGTLQGTLHVTYTGLEANWRRLSERNEDATERRKFLEDDVSGFVPTGVDVKLTNAPDWNGAESPLKADFDISIPGWASAAGHRLLLPVGLFGASERHTFEHKERVHPIYFLYPCQQIDRVTIALPEGWRVDSVPAPHAVDMGGVTFKSTTEQSEGALVLTRELTRKMYFAPIKYYPPLQHFFESVRSSDEEQVTLATAVAHK